MMDQLNEIRTRQIWNNWSTTLAPSDSGNINDPNIWENYIENMNVNRPCHSSYGGAIWGERHNTIGIDCGGLVYKAADYTGNSYPVMYLEAENPNGPIPPGLVPGMNRVWVHAGNTGQPMNDPENLWEISRRVPRGEFDNNLNKTIPGDIFYFYHGIQNGEYTGYHVRIVRSISFDSSRNTEDTQIRLIEAIFDENDAFGNQFGNVIIFRELFWYRDQRPNATIITGRLIWQ